MPRSRQLSFSQSNLVWFVVVLVAIAVGALAGGWKVALIAGALGLVVSEIFERTARAKRLRA